MNLETYEQKLIELEIKQKYETDILKRQYAMSITLYDIGDTMICYKDCITISSIGFRCNCNSDNLPEPIYYGKDENGYNRKIYHSELIN